MVKYYDIANSQAAFENGNGYIELPVETIYNKIYLILVSTINIFIWKKTFYGTSNTPTLWRIVGKLGGVKMAFKQQVCKSCYINSV